MDEINTLSWHANIGQSGAQNDNIPPSLNLDIQRRPPHPHRRDRGADQVGLLVRVPSHKAKRTGSELNSDITCFGIS
jgi:hypothetical protein